MSMILVIGSKRWSSWSLRPWLAMKQAGLPFEERLIGLRQPDTKAKILAHSPSGKVPLLIDGDLKIWDSLAILEYLAERFPDAGFWPSGTAARAQARSIAAEMHSGFAALRRELPMDVTATLKQDLSPEVADDIARIQAVWRDARSRFGAAGPFLFGRFGNADAMYAPVVTRFRTYGVALDAVCRDYADAVLALPAMVAWYGDAAGETD
jgi:glutathione S-transferase